jgi:hypothetical protein
LAVFEWLTRRIHGALPGVEGMANFSHGMPLALPSAKGFTARIACGPRGDVAGIVVNSWKNQPVIAAGHS